MHLKGVGCKTLPTKNKVENVIKTKKGGGLKTSDTKKNKNPIENEGLSENMKIGLSTHIPLHKKLLVKKTLLKEKSVPIIMWNKGNSKFLSKKDEIEMIINKHSPSIFGILEANISKDIHLPALQINGY